MYVSTGAHPIQKRILDPVDMGLFTGGCEPNVGAENPVWVFCKSSMFSYTELSLQQVDHLWAYILYHISGNH